MSSGHVTSAQMEQVKSVVKEHLEKHKFFDSLKSAVAKDPKLTKLDRGAVIEKLKHEGLLNEIINSIPTNKKSQVQMANKTRDVENLNKT
jgi:hypothetical protein